ncbi:hypothetical protein Tco_0814268 [Tanacetum coccineum]
MAALTIANSSDSSDESMGSPPSRVILFGDIPTVIPSTSVVAPVISSAAHVVETTLVASPTELYGLVPYSDFDFDSPNEMDSPEYITSLPATSPFLCTDSSKAPDSSDGPPSQDLYVTTVACWRSRVTAHSPSPSDFLIAPVTAPPGTCRQAAILIRLGEAIPLDHCPSSSSSSSDSSPVYSSGLDAPDQDHSGSSTRDVSPRLGYPPRRAPRRSEAFLRWCAAPLSTFYLPTTSESSSGDSSERPLHSSSHSDGPSRKRCRSPVDSVPSSTLVMGSLAPTRADLLPPRKRFRDSYSSEASIEEDTEVDPIKTEVDMELGIGDEDDVRDHVEIDPRDVRDDTEEYEADTSAGDMVEVGIDPMSAPIVEEEIVEPAEEGSSDSSGTKYGIVRSFKDMSIDLNDAVHDFYHHMFERAGMIERIESLRLENFKVRTMLDIERDRVNNLRLHMSLSHEEFQQECNDNRGGDGNGNGTGNGNNGGNNGDGNENRNVNGRGDMHVARECTYQDFMKCQPLSFKGTEGVVGLIRWSEKMETVFHISNCPERYEAKYATCTLLDSALTWWNSHKRTIGTDAAYALSWRNLLKLMTEAYCPRNKIQKMET